MAEAHLLRKVNLRVWLILVLLALTTFHKPSEGLTAFEVLLGGILAIIYMLGVVKFLITRTRSPRPLLSFLLFGIWITFNVLLAVASDINLVWWFRNFFSAFSLPMMALFTYIEFRTLPHILITYISLIVLTTISILKDLLWLLEVDINEIDDLDPLRQHSGQFFGSFSLCLALPLLFQHPSLWLIITISALGLLLSFTRTFWISTAISLLFMFYLLMKAYKRHLGPS